ncbi:MAG: ABC transporter permease subunit [Bdellovibrionaceae bacterium]|nr:ABC transporter permease subunit [Pseudobdellovibrionaceae bacterium]
MTSSSSVGSNFTSQSLSDVVVEAIDVPSAWREFWESLRANRGALLGLAVVLAFVVIALLAPWLAPYDPSQVHEGAFKLPPVWQDGGQWAYVLGTDDVGRDLLSRLIHGARISMGVGFMVVIFSMSIGVAIGLLAGYAGGWVDALIMRLTDVMLSLPSILLAIVVVTVLGQSLANAIVAVGVLVVPNFIRLVRASVLAERNKQYVIASRSLGSSHWRQAVVNILPNCMAPVIVQATLGFSDGILNVAALGFLGLGAKPPTAEWGTMLSDGRAYIESASWLVTLPGLCILIVVLGFNLLGDGLRDALDPRLKR